MHALQTTVWTVSLCGVPAIVNAALLGFALATAPARAALRPVVLSVRGVNQKPRWGLTSTPCLVQWCADSFIDWLMIDRLFTFFVASFIAQCFGSTLRSVGHQHSEIAYSEIAGTASSESGGSMPRRALPRARHLFWLCGAVCDAVCGVCM